MNVKELLNYIEYLENFKDQLINDQQLYLRQQIDVLKMLAVKLNETLSLFAYAALYNEGELRFPKSYFEIHESLDFGLNFDKDSDPDFVIVRLTQKEREEEVDEND